MGPDRRVAYSNSAAAIRCGSAAAAPARRSLPAGRKTSQKTKKPTIRAAEASLLLDCRVHCGRPPAGCRSRRMHDQARAAPAPGPRNRARRSSRWGAGGQTRRRRSSMMLARARAHHADPAGKIGRFAQIMGDEHHGRDCPLHPERLHASDQSSSRVNWSSAPKGSSSSSRSGSCTSARQRLARCIIPPESCQGFFSAKSRSDRPDRAAHRPARLIFAASASSLEGWL